jgi:hypothetical protein
MRFQVPGFLPGPDNKRLWDKMEKGPYLTVRVAGYLCHLNLAKNELQLLKLSGSCILGHMLL